MAARSIASMSVSFGLVSIPVKLYSATEGSAAIHFKLLGQDGSRVRQQYVSDGPPPGSPTEKEPPESVRPVVGVLTPFRPHLIAKSMTLSPSEGSPASARSAAADESDDEDEPQESASTAAPSIVERSEMLRGYEFEKGKFVTFTADELKALQEGARETIDIVSFIPARSVDPTYFHKAYFLAPDKRGAKPYGLLLEAMRTTGRCALAKWAFRAKEYVVQIRPTEGGLVLQQLFYAEEVRSIADLKIDLVSVGAAELKLAQQLIEQISVDSYDPSQFLDEEKKRILAAVEAKIAGKRIVAPAQAEPAGGHVIDLVEALRASLAKAPDMSIKAAPAPRSAAEVGKLDLGARKPVRRAGRPDEGPTKRRAKK